MVADTTSATGSEKNAASAVSSDRQKDQSGKEDKLPKGRAEECQLHLAEGSGLIYQRILYGQRDNHKGEPLNISDGTAAKSQDLL